MSGMDINYGRRCIGSVRMERDMSFLNSFTAYVGLSFSAQIEL